MAISFVGSAVAAGASSAFDITLPTCQEGDVVIVETGWASAGDDAPGVSTSGYAEIVEIYQTETNRLNMSVSWKRMGSAPDETVTCLGSGSANFGAVGIAYVLRGVDSTTPFDVAYAAAQGSGGSVPDPPSITPTSEGTLIVILGMGTAGVNAGDPTVTVPSGYSNAVNHYSNAGLKSITVAAASKAWTSGAENPGAWTNWTTTTADSWGAVTLALRAVQPLTPPTGSISITGSTPATTVSTVSGSVAISPGTPVPGIGFPVYPASGEILITGGTPTVSNLPVIMPFTAQMRITAQTPEVHDGVSLVISLPTIAPLFQALGNYATLNVSLPALVFAGATSSPSWLDVDLPTLVPAFAAGTALTVDLPFPEVQFSAVMGATCTLDVDLPTLIFSAGAGAAFALDLPDLAPLFTSTTGSVASLNVTLPAFAALFSADVENLAQLVVHLPDLLPAFSSHQQTLGQLIVDLPPLSVLFSGSAGGAASLHVTLPELQVLLTSYEEITGQMVVVLPALKALFSAAQSGRFDTTTALQLDGTVLRYRRPV